MPLALQRTLLLPLLLLIHVADAPSASAADPETIVDRDEDPVIVLGSGVPDWLGEPIGNIAAFTWNAGSGSFQPIPFQVDQKVVHTFSPGTSLQVSEEMYDVLHEGSGKLGPDDEIALMDIDAGPQAPAGATWPAGAAATRFEVLVHDPRPGGPWPDRLVYLFSGSGLARSSTNYVFWDLQETTSITSDRYALDYIDRWLLTGFRVFSPCGGGMDLIDRYKGRAGIALDNAEDEDEWNAASTYLGGILGPVRAIRYVHGAASGLNTVLHDVVYRGRWDHTVNLRVHGLDNLWMYVDWLPHADTVFFRTDERTGVAIDGVPDPSVPAASIQPWNLVRGPDGGLEILSNSPPSPFYKSANAFYLDDASYNDATIDDPGYSSDDKSAIGDHGTQLINLSGTETDTIPLGSISYPLCAGEGDATLGDEIRQLIDVPLAVTGTFENANGPAVRTLSVSKSGTDAQLSWSAVPGATSYLVYESTSPSTPQTNWSLLAQVSAPSWTDGGAAPPSPNAYYSIVAVYPTGPGPW